MALACIHLMLFASNLNLTSVSRKRLAVTHGITRRGLRKRWLPLPWPQHRVVV